ncbi:MAG: PAS domain-containing protein [Anaeromyxobacter sp.]|nr:PAS domain-containing protein [Anaeromyxobacter sp.]MBL0277408.1 PAS domain-containing protein [Anaeromyxobacter sp.]
MVPSLGPGALRALLLAAVAALTAVVSGLLFLRDVTRLDPHFAALAWRTATVAALSIAVATGALALLLSMLADRTRRAEEALAEARREREARRAELATIQAIVDSMADGVIFIDAKETIALVNKAGRVLKNLSQGAGADVRDCHPKASHQVLERVMGYLRSGDDAGPAHSIIKEKEGRFETTYAPVSSPEGAYLGTVMVIRDIAERRHLETRLLDAERLAGLGQMSAQIAHELRNPLNAIDGAAQYLARRLAGDAEVAEYAGLIGEEVQRVNRFVSALLHVARPAEPVLAPVAVNRVAKEAAQKVALARGLPADLVRLELARDLPPLDLDAPMVSEALVNLLQNALDAGGEPPTLVTRTEGSGGEGAVVLEVLDRGCGIEADRLDEVRRPFVTSKPHGTGLGLVIVQRAAELHRARFGLAQREGGGTVAALRFPVRRVASAVAGEA